MEIPRDPSVSPRDAASRKTSTAFCTWRRFSASLDADHRIAQGRARNTGFIYPDLGIEVEFREFRDQGLERGLLLRRRVGGGRQVAVEIDVVEHRAYEALGRHDAGFEVRVVEAAGDLPVLFDLDQAIQQLPADHLGAIALTGVYHNLLRRWADV